MSQVVKAALIAWNELINKQPDILNDKSLFLIIQILSKNLGDDLTILCLQHIKHASVLHEFNRQNTMNSGILSSLKPLLKTQNPEVNGKWSISDQFFFYAQKVASNLIVNLSDWYFVQVLKETCAVFRHLILDDDVRIEFSKAHEHARNIAGDVLIDLTQLLPRKLICHRILSIYTD